MRSEIDSESILLGVLLMVLAMATFTAMDTVSKLLTSEYSGIQVAWARYTFHLAPLVLFAGPRRLADMARVANPTRQILRGASLAVSAVCIIVAFSLVPLADAIAVSFMAPLIIVALSAPMLGEQVGPHRWIAVAAGFSGVLVLAWPSGEVFETGTAFALAAALFWAIGLLLTRQLRSDDPWSTLFYTALVGTVLLSLVVPFSWRPPPLAGWGLMLAMGLIGGLAHTLLIYAFRYASASLLAPFNYTQLIWATLAGWLTFNEVPSLRAAAGAAVIVASGLYAGQRERLAAKRRP